VPSPALYSDTCRRLAPAGALWIMMRSHALVTLVGFALVVLSACSSTAPASGSSAVTKTIGPEGGQIVVEGATITFPPNALAAATAITITPTDDPAPEGYMAISRIYRCEPSGTTFAQKVSMAITFSGDATGATVFWSAGADPAFKDVGGTVSGSVITAGVGHFSSGFAGKKL
jgi:hypothetical protein